MSARSEIVTAGAERMREPRRTPIKLVRNRFLATGEKDSLLILLFALHVPLGVLMYNFSALTILHPIAIVALGIYWAVQPRVPISRVAYLVGYLIGVEVLWRMTSAPVYWEFGKYASTVIMIVALVRRNLVRIPSLPFFYLLLLIPACYLTFAFNTWVLTTNRLSFNMSGPLCLFVSCWFFSQIRLNETGLKKLLLSIAVPLVSVAVATLFFTVTNPNLEFTNESNPLTSGGFGPNQVSSMLGLGVFIATAALLLFKNDVRSAIFLCGLALLFTAQSVLTFSRGGIYAAVGALAVLAIFQARDFGQFLYRALPVAVAAAVFIFLVFPSLNDFTGGKLEERFESSDTTNRLSLMGTEVQVFLENPVLGVGVGEAIDERYDMTSRFSASHTEFTRLLSEHGMLGILAMISLLAATIHNLRKQPSRIGKAVVAGAIVWSGLFMMNSGMRLAAPAFMWGLSFVLVVGSHAARRDKHQLVQAKRKRYGVVPAIRRQSRPRPQAG